MNYLNVRVDAKLRVDVRGIDDEDVERLKAEFVHKNPQFYKLKMMKLPTYKEPATIRTWQGAPGQLLLPRGGTARLRAWAEELGREVWWHDDRTNPDPDTSIFPAHQVQLYDYQEAMVAAGLAKENCLLRASTGSGKTVAAMAMLARLGVPGLVIVNNGALHEQWLERAEKDFGLRDRDVGVIRAGKLRLRPLTIAMQQTLYKLGEDDRKAVGSYFGALIADEVQGAAARTFLEVFDWIPARYRIGVSASECVARGTLITMGDGTFRPIEDVRGGDMVLTPYGPRRVRHAWFRGIKETIAVEWGVGGGMRATKNTWFAAKTEWVVAESVSYVSLLTDEGFGALLRQSVQGLRPPDASTLPRRISHTMRAGAAEIASVVVEGFDQSDSSVIGEYVTQTQCAQEGQAGAMGEGVDGQDPREPGCPCEEDCYDSGAVRERRAEVGMAYNNGRLWAPTECSGDACGADIEAPGSSSHTQDRDGQRARSSAALQGGLCAYRQEASGRDRRVESQGPRRAGPTQGSPTGSVGVAGSSIQVDMRSLRAAERGHVRAQATVNHTVLELPVFDLEVEEAACYYANGVLLHNCRKDKKEFLIYDLFGEVAYEVSRATLAERNFVVDVEVRALETEAQVGWYRATSKANTQFNRLLDALTVDDTRNTIAADIAAEEVKRGHQVLMFSHRRDHCERLSAFMAARGIPTGVMLGGPESAAELERSAAALRSGKMRCAVGTIQAIGTGIDLPSISRGVLTTPIVSNKQLLGQVTGRLCRTSAGKQDAMLYYLHDGEAFGDYPLRNLRKWVPVVTWQDAKGAIIPIDERLDRHAGHGDQVTLEQMLG